MCLLKRTTQGNNMNREQIITKATEELPAVVAAKHGGTRNGWRYRLRAALVAVGVDYNEATYLGHDLLRAAQKEAGR